MVENRREQKSYHKVLVLNSTHEAINITSWRRAMVLVYKGKASGVEYNGDLINDKYPLPEVIRLARYVLMPYSEVVLSRKNIYLRDNYTCQYCGKSGSNMTIDHILPRSRGGKESWENMAVCCARCNNRKGNRSLEETGMKLMGVPYRPPSALYLHMTRLSGVPESWYNYFFKNN